MMKYKTALGILEDRAFNFYGLTWDRYIHLITTCGMTLREEEAYERYMIEMMR
jgi:hypothetical protein